MYPIHIMTYLYRVYVVIYRFAIQNINLIILMTK